MAVGNVTQILNAIQGGDGRAVDQLLPALYEDLRHLAAQKLSREKPGQTLQATALVHEAYLSCWAQTLTTGARDAAVVGWTDASA
jgi:DNA-directed RNA polymerase specialized sigma24 family protein